ncbi:MAG: N-acetylglucosamine kinase [Oscillospiraceae bacterium]|nr:N-acetylglucosamine kinase [Oscillospiraceae bacterium]
MKYVLGVDGGNTKTDYMVFTADGALVRHKRYGTISHERFPEAFDKTRELLAAHIGEVLDGLAEPEDVAAAFGLAGLDMPFQGDKLKEIISDTGFKLFGAANDGVLGIKAAAPNGYGVCSINGTGTVAAGIDPKGTFRQVSGVHPFSGDEGGGGELTRQTARRVYDELFRFGRPTAMTGRLLNLLEITDKHLYQEVYLNRVYNDIKDWQVSDIMLDCALDGDAVASEALETVGTEMARSAAGCARELDFTGVVIDVVWAGSLWIKPKTPLMRDAFKREFNRLLDCDANFISLNMPPASGAVLWALELNNGAFPQGGLKAKVMDQIQQIKM